MEKEINMEEEIKITKGWKDADDNVEIKGIRIQSQYEPEELAEQFSIDYKNYHVAFKIYDKYNRIEIIKVFISAIKELGKLVETI